MSDDRTLATNSSNNVGPIERQGRGIIDNQNQFGQFAATRIRIRICICMAIEKISSPPTQERAGREKEGSAHVDCTYKLHPRRTLQSLVRPSCRIRTCPSNHFGKMYLMSRSMKLGDVKATATCSILTSYPTRRGSRPCGLRYSGSQHKDKRHQLQTGLPRSIASAMPTDGDTHIDEFYQLFCQFPFPRDCQFPELGRGLGREGNKSVRSFKGMSFSLSQCLSIQPPTKTYAHQHYFLSAFLSESE